MTAPIFTKKPTTTTRQISHKVLKSIWNISTCNPVTARKIGLSKAAQIVSSFVIKDVPMGGPSGRDRPKIIGPIGECCPITSLTNPERRTKTKMQTMQSSLVEPLPRCFTNQSINGLTTNTRRRANAIMDRAMNIRVRMSPFLFSSIATAITVKAKVGILLRIATDIANRPISVLRTLISVKSTAMLMNIVKLCEKPIIGSAFATLFFIATCCFNSTDSPVGITNVNKQTDIARARGSFSVFNNV
ncbi:unnamed protein product [Sphenostylis stenocarpa]|uniref:Uncharacterized protein n=1 Tax=Sphenostylis stenocarpa TaxID=92480 RepID=A0AA86SC92_9FABA|nr:unnamed protein product [Sphenostylis stenocarpa]